MPGRLCTLLTLCCFSVIWTAGACTPLSTPPANDDIDMPTDDQNEQSGDQSPPRVLLETSMGDILIELDDQAAPIAVENFLQYVEDGFYDGRDGLGETVFHRVVPNFVIQGGGLTAQCAQKTTRDPILNEAADTASNKRGTLSMAQTNDPNSGTSQFFINLVDNTLLDFVEGQFQGHAVFGTVVQGMDVVDAIAAVETGTCPPPANTFTDVPVTPVVITFASRTSSP